MTIEYEDFELEIGAGDGVTFPLSVVHSPAGNARAQFEFPLGQLELENRLLALQNALLRSGGSRRTVLSREEETVREFGRTLFTALFRDDVRSLYYESKRAAHLQNKGLRLKLRIVSPQLAALPWEYLFDEREGDYLCLSESTPLVRYLEVTQPARPLAVTGPLRVLAMVASPTGLAALNVDEEKQRLERALGSLQASGQVELTWLAGQTWRDLQREMRPGHGPWHVFHFIGHGGFDPQREEGFLAVSDENGDVYPLWASQLGRMLADHRSLRLVLLNACEGAQGGQVDLFSSAAATLVRRGVPAVVAMQYEITDRAAIEFAEQFYDAVADGLPVDTAVAEARKSVSFAINNTLEWGIPVLFMQAPDGVLFDRNSMPDSVGTLPVLREIQEPQPEPEEPTPIQPQPIQTGQALPGARLSGRQLKELQDAMLDAYTSQASLRQMVRIELDENLETIAGGGNLAEQTFNLIEWAQRTGRTLELVEKAHHANPGNARLRTFAASVAGNAPAPQSGSSSPAHVSPAPPQPVALSSLTGDAVALIEALQHDEVVPFVGAGLSIGAGLPGWYELIAELAQRSGQTMPPREWATADSMIAIAQGYINAQGLNSLIRLLKDRLDTTGRTPSEAHRALARLSVSLVFTANYDNLLELAFRDAGRRVEVVVRDSNIPYMRRSRDTVNIIKLYGDLDQPDTVVLARQQYERFFLDRPEMVKLLETEVARSHMLYLGWSHSDPHFGLIFGQMLSSLGENLRAGYAALFDVTPAEAEELRRRHIRVVDLPPGPNKNAQLATWLTGLQT